jgi:ribosome-binding ATPase
MLSAGIVGLPNVGKSTLFNAVTRTRKAEAANYPFCTIEPNQGIVMVPDERLDALSKLSRSEKTISAAIEFVDIAGLVQGASQGEGLGNQFLSHIREVDAIVQVVRCFESSDIHHVSGHVDPIRDIEVINTELILADITTVTKRSERIQKQVRSGDKQAKAEEAILVKLLPHLNAGKPAVTLELSPDEKILLAGFFLLTSKPTIFACNVGESDLTALVAGKQDSTAAKHVTAVAEYVKSHLSTESVI